MRTMPFYCNMNELSFFFDDIRKIIGANITKNGQSLTIQFVSRNVIEYSYASEGNDNSIFRMTGRAKLTFSIMNSHFIEKILSSIR